MEYNEQDINKKETSQSICIILHLPSPPQLRNLVIIYPARIVHTIGRAQAAGKGLAATRTPRDFLLCSLYYYLQYVCVDLGRAREPLPRIFALYLVFSPVCQRVARQSQGCCIALWLSRPVGLDCFFFSTTGILSNRGPGGWKRAAAVGLWLEGKVGGW